MKRKILINPIKRRFQFYKQLNAMDCGPTCLRMISRFYGKHYSLETIRQITGFNKAGSSLLGISEAAEKLGFRTRAVKISYDQLISEANFPCLLHWNQEHFVVMLPLSKWGINRRISIADPAKGILSFSQLEFSKHWISTKTSLGLELGTVMTMEPTSSFYDQEAEKENKLSWRLITQYLNQSSWQIIQVFFAMVAASILQLIFPYLLQSLVDTGINTENLQYITIILIAQLMLMFSKTIIDFIRSRLLLGISIVINMSILSDFWIKLTRLPISYFDNHKTGDTLQRLSDNKQIQTFLTGSALNTIFSTITFVMFSFILLSYSPNHEIFKSWVTNPALAILFRTVLYPKNLNSA